jgi:hypothetical protein
LSGIGGVAVDYYGYDRFGITTNFVLDNPPSGTSLELLSGRNLKVSGLNVTNTAGLYGSDTGGSNDIYHNGRSGGQVAVFKSSIIIQFGH